MTTTTYATETARSVDVLARSVTASTLPAISQDAQSAGLTWPSRTETFGASAFGRHL